MEIKNINDVANFLDELFSGITSGLKLYTAAFNRKTLELSSNDKIECDEDFLKIYYVGSIQFLPEEGMMPYLCFRSKYRVPIYYDIPIGLAEYICSNNDHSYGYFVCVAKSEDEATSIFNATLKLWKTMDPKQLEHIFQ